MAASSIASSATGLMKTVTAKAAKKAKQLMEAASPKPKNMSTPAESAAGKATAVVSTIKKKKTIRRMLGGLTIGGPGKERRGKETTASGNSGSPSGKAAAPAAPCADMWFCRGCNVFLSGDSFFASCKKYRNSLCKKCKSARAKVSIRERTKDRSKAIRMLKRTRQAYKNVSNLPAWLRKNNVDPFSRFLENFPTSVLTGHRRALTIVPFFPLDEGAVWEEWNTVCITVNELQTIFKMYDTYEDFTVQGMMHKAPEIVTEVLRAKERYMERLAQKESAAKLKKAKATAPADAAQ